MLRSAAGIGSLFLLVSVVFALPGCAVPVAVAASAGLGAAQAGGSAWVAGELRAAKYADLDTVFAAAEQAMDDLEVNIITNRRGEKSAFIMAKEPGGPEIRISMSRRAPKLTRIGIRVGMIGDLASSRGVLLRIHANLPPEAIVPMPQ